MFIENLEKACLKAAKALGDDINKISWLLRNQSRVDHIDSDKKAA